MTSWLRTLLGLLALAIYMWALIAANVLGIAWGLGGRSSAERGTGMPASYLADGTLPALPRLNPSVAVDAARDAGAHSGTADQANGTGNGQPVTQPSTAPQVTPSIRPTPWPTAHPTPQPTPRPMPKPRTPSPTPRPVATVPGAPTNVVAVHSKGSRMLNWTPPASTGGRPIIEYLITGSYGYTATAPGSATSITLILGSNQYTFTVRAVNAVGAGPASAPSNPITG